jgi:hypothetical protein
MKADLSYAGSEANQEKNPKITERKAALVDLINNLS